MGRENEVYLDKEHRERERERKPTETRRREVMWFGG